MIPLNDLKAQHDSIKDEINAAIASVINKSQFIGGEAKDEFEKNFAQFCGKEYCIGTSSGSTALFTVLKCLGIGKDDEVIIPANTFVATAFSVTLCGAKPVFVDVNENDFLINTDLIEKTITDKTKAIIPVHLHGAVCDMEKIIEIAKKHNLKIIEDSAQAHGATYKGKKVPITEIGCFSYFPAKNLGALGDAGSIVCDDRELAKKCRKFINHGRSEKYLHDTEGFNFRLDNLQAAILNVKLKHLDKWTEKKRKLVTKYNEKLTKYVQSQTFNSEIESAYHLYIIKTKDRDNLKEFLAKNDIQTGIHYPMPLHLQPVFSYLNYKEGDLPISEKLAKEILSLPLYPDLVEEDQSKVINYIKEFFGKDN